MRPWAEATTSESWGIHESGEQFLVYLGKAAAPELDLSGESVDFEIFPVDPETGHVGLAVGRVTGGGRVDMENWMEEGPAVLWGRRAGLENENDD